MDQHIVMCARCDTPVDIRNPVCSCRPDPRDTEITSLHAEVATLKGDLNIARLQRDAKLCSECPRSDVLTAAQTEIGRLREECAVTAWMTGMNLYEQRFDWDPREVGSAIAVAIRNLTPPSQAPEARRDVGGEKL